ncbi:MAG: hypothetical protein ABSF95_16395 [Verrucomicrobiota bacterium]
MIRAHSLVVISVLALAAWAVGIQAAQPDFQSSSMVLTRRLDEVISAITNAFANGAYHEMKLGDSRVDYVMRNGKEIAVPQTNAWILDPQQMPLTLLPHGKKMVAYREYFEIKAEALGSGYSKVSVKPAGSATTQDRYQFSMHLHRILGGRFEPPLASETTNLFQRIEKQLREIQAGRTNALPPTPDTKPGFYRDFWTKMDVKEQHDSRNWKKMVEAWKAIQTLQAGTNNAGAVTNGVK